MNNIKTILSEKLMTKKYSSTILLSKKRLTLNIFSLALLALLLNSCIEEFNPDLNGSVELVVIDGKIIKGERVQQVIVSRSTPINNNEFKPIKSCTVWVIDDANRTFSFEEKSDGIYQAEIPEEYLSYNSRFKLRVTTPNKDEYESDYETILESSPIDSVYYAEESYQSSSEYHDIGLQFYTDLKAPDKNTKNYRWQITETWEYNSINVIHGFYDVELDTLIHYEHVVDSIYVCWSTNQINELFTSSTENLLVNEKKRIPLSYIPGSSYKLTVKYSVLVKQYALSDEAYVYWDKNKVQAKESGGLYQTQPSQSKSNIRNLNDPNEIVLGFFWASSFTEKHAFFKGPLSGHNYNYECPADTLNGDKFLELKENCFLFILKPNDSEAKIIWATSTPPCMDCTKQGGTNIKPDFWE